MDSGIQVKQSFVRV